MVIKNVADLGNKCLYVRQSSLDSRDNLLTVYLFGNILVDEDDGDVLAADEALQRVLDLLDLGVLVHHEEVGLPVLVELPDPAQQEANTRVLVADDSDQLPASRVQSHGDCDKIVFCKDTSLRIGRSLQILLCWCTNISLRTSKYQLLASERWQGGLVQGIQSVGLVHSAVSLRVALKRSDIKRNRTFDLIPKFCPP